jgi:hypothetical protein
MFTAASKRSLIFWTCPLSHFFFSNHEVSEVDSVPFYFVGLLAQLNSLGVQGVKNGSAKDPKIPYFTM